MKPFQTIVIAAIVSILAAYGTVKITSSHHSAEAPKKESAYDRVMRTGTINCGYFVWPPFLIKDGNTGKLSGVLYDLTEKIAKALSLKVEWKTEVGAGDFATALETGKIDMVCAPMTYTASRARASDFSASMAYGGVYAYARPDDARFTSGDLDRINSEDVIISVMDGELGALLAQNNFYKAKTNQVQQLSTKGELYQNVVDKKADVIFSDQDSMKDFLKNTPGALQQIGSKPVSVFSLVYPVKQDEYKFTQMINWAIKEMHDTGQVEAVFGKYNLTPDTLFRVQKPYEIPSKP